MITAAAVKGTSVCWDAPKNFYPTVVVCAEQAGTHLVLAMKVNDNVLQREASFLTQAGQHVFDELAAARGSQGSAAIGQVDATVAAATSVPLLWRTRAEFSILDQARKEVKALFWLGCNH